MRAIISLVLGLGLAAGAWAAAIPGTVVSAKITTGSTANTNFSIGDTSEMTGTDKQAADAAARLAIPAARRTEGMTCYQIDTGKFWRLVGGIANSNWTNAVPEFTPMVYTTGSVVAAEARIVSLAATVVDPSSIFFNVRTYGAVGDGVTDDSAALATAWQAWTNAELGGVLYFPRGTYRCSNLFRVNDIHQSDAWNSIFINSPESTLSIRGDSMGASTILWSGTNQTMFISTDANVPMSDISFMCETYATGGTNNGFLSAGGNGNGSVTWNNVGFVGFMGNGANLQNSFGCFLNGCVFGKCGVGLKLPVHCDGIHTTIMASYCTNAGVYIGAGKNFGATSGDVFITGRENNIGVIVSADSVNWTIGGYLEATTNCAVAIGAPYYMAEDGGDASSATTITHINNFHQMSSGTTPLVKIFQYNQYNTLMLDNCYNAAFGSCTVQIMTNAADGSTIYGNGVRDLGSGGQGLAVKLSTGVTYYGSKLGDVTLVNANFQTLGSGTYIGNGIGLSNLNAANLTGTLPDAAFPAVLPAVDGSQLTGVLAGSATNAVALTNGWANNLVVTNPFTVKDAAGNVAFSVSNGVVEAWGTNGTTTVSNLVATGVITGNGAGITNGSPALATNNASASDGMALVKRGDNLKLETITGVGGGGGYTNGDMVGTSLTNGNSITVTGTVTSASVVANGGGTNRLGTTVITNLTTLAGTFTGDGSGLTNVAGTGGVPLNGTNTWTGTNVFNKDITMAGTGSDTGAGVKLGVDAGVPYLRLTDAMPTSVELRYDNMDNKGWNFGADRFTAGIATFDDIQVKTNMWVQNDLFVKRDLYVTNGTFHVGASSFVITNAVAATVLRHEGTNVLQLATNAVTALVPFTVNSGGTNTLGPTIITNLTMLAGTVPSAALPIMGTTTGTRGVGYADNTTVLIDANGRLSANITGGTATNVPIIVAGTNVVVDVNELTNTISIVSLTNAWRVDATNAAMAVTNGYAWTNLPASSVLAAITNQWKVDATNAATAATNGFPWTNIVVAQATHATNADNAVNATNFVGTSLNISGTLSAGTFIVTNGIDGTNITGARSVALSVIAATGTANSSSYLCGDGTWAVPAGGGGTLWSTAGNAIFPSNVSGTNTGWIAASGKLYPQ